MGINRAREVSVPVAEALRRRPSRWQSFSRFLKRKPLGAAGLVIIVALVFVAVLAEIISPHDPYEVEGYKTFLAPSREYILGTDDFGRDVLSRVIYGSRISLVVGIFSVAGGATMGALLGLMGGYWGRRIDNVIQRIMDIMLAFPMLVLALAIVAALGSTIPNVIIAIAFPMVPRAARVIRSSVLSVKETQYIDAAVGIGCSDLRIIFRHVLPNCLAPWVVLATAQLGGAILVEATLSFLGLGIPPPHPSWGRMMTGAGRQYLEIAPWLTVFPGIAISLAVFGFNLLGDALRDVWDPRLRGR